MFSFLKKLNQMLDRLKKNKGLWFTTLSVISTSGIVISMILISTMTSSTEQKIFGKEARDFKTFYGNVLMNRYNEMYTFGYVLANDKRIIDALKQKRLQTASQIALGVQESANKFLETDKRYIRIYQLGSVEMERNEVVRLSTSQKQDVSGLAVDPDGIFLKTIIPILDNETVLGAVEIKQLFHTINREFGDASKEFAFLLKNDMVAQLNLEIRTGSYKKLNDEFSVVEGAYTNKFYTNILFHKPQEIFSNDFIKDEDFYTVPFKVYDTVGKEIGFAILGENAANAEGFVQTTKSLVNNVITLALALVISMILFIF